jgi:uncharacterized protein YukJ
MKNTPNGAFHDLGIIVHLSSDKCHVFLVTFDTSIHSRKIR